MDSPIVRPKSKSLFPSTATTLEATMAVSDNTKPVFKQFDVVSDHSDHKYSKDISSFTNKTVSKKIMAEWRILEKDLPENIYVRMYETRLDLVRAVIIGAEGTPYEDGLFFFDIKFPDNYPNEPPMVFYHSHGLHVNINLYECGKVCLSLLNTTYGRGNEQWDSSQSTLLQVLVSIQALVLNEQPFFNTPRTGFLKRWFGMKGTSELYNGNVFISTRKSMFYLLQNPPKNFEAFTAEHFRGRATRILRACNAFAKRGHYKDTVACRSPFWLLMFSNKKLKKWMKQLYPDLVKAFEKNEASLMHVESGQGSYRLSEEDAGQEVMAKRIESENVHEES